MIWRASLAAFVCCTALGMFAGRAVAQDASAPVCHSKPDSAAVVAARAALEADSSLLPARFDLADGLERQGCFQDAVKVLEDGQAGHPRDTELQNRLRFARSQITEQEYFAGLAQAQEDAKLKRALLRCQKLNDVDACDEALIAKPDNVDVLTSKSDALVALHRPSEAIPVLRHVLTIDKTSDALHGKLASAEAQRAQLLMRCESDSGEPALAACQAALLRGEADEFEVQSRRGALLQASSRTSAALDAYIAAGTLRPQDHAVALAIVALTESTARKDPVVMQARKVARDTIAREASTGSALRAAREMNPNLPPLATRLSAGRHSASEPAPAALASNTAPAEPRKIYSNGVTDGHAH